MITMQTDAIGATARGEALATLTAEVAAFERLDGRTRHVEQPGDPLVSAVVAAVHSLCARIAQCELAGASRAEIAAALAPARAILGRAPLLRRLQDWPRGYPGDYETIEHLCSGRPAPGLKGIDLIGERYSLGCAGAQQHRNKVAQQALLIANQVAARSDSRILSIACGGCLDVRLVLSLLRGRSFELLLNDADPDALAFSAAQLSPIADRLTLRCCDVLRLLRRPAELGQLDLVLAGGLFDYLSDRQLRFVLSQAFKLLRPEGKLFFTNMAIGNPYRVWVGYLASWHLIERSEADIERIIASAGLPLDALTIERDATGLTLLAQLTAPRA